MPTDNSDKVIISSSFTYSRDKPSDFVPTEPPPTRLVSDHGAFPWDLPYLWEQQKDLGWPSEIAEADDPLAVFLDKITGHGRDFYDPLILVPDEDREYWHAVLNSVLRRPGGFVWPDDYDTVGVFALGMGGTPAETAWWERRVFATLLEDARTLQAILERYEAKNFIRPSAPPNRGPTPDPTRFWEARARREHEMGNTREAYAETFAAYLKLPGWKPETRAEKLAYARKQIFNARKRLEIPAGKKNPE